VLMCLLTTTFPGRSVHSPVKYVFFTVAYNIWPKFGRTFGTRSVSLPKPSASAECYSLTFGPSLLCMGMFSCPIPTSFPLFVLLLLFIFTGVVPVCPIHTCTWECFHVPFPPRSHCLFSCCHSFLQAWFLFVPYTHVHGNAFMSHSHLVSTVFSPAAIHFCMRGSCLSHTHMYMGMLSCPIPTSFPLFVLLLPFISADVVPVCAVSARAFCPSLSFLPE